MRQSGDEEEQVNNLRFRGIIIIRERLYFLRKLKATFWSQILINSRRAAIGEHPDCKHCMVRSWLRTGRLYSRWLKLPIISLATRTWWYFDAKAVPWFCTVRGYSAYILARKINLSVERTDGPPGRQFRHPPVWSRVITSGGHGPFTDIVCVCVCVCVCVHL